MIDGEKGNVYLGNVGECKGDNFDDGVDFDSFDCYVFNNDQNNNTVNNNINNSNVTSSEYHLNIIRKCIEENKMLRFCINDRNEEGVAPVSLLIQAIQQIHSGIAHRGVSCLFHSTRRILSCDYLFFICVYVSNLCSVCSRIKPPHGAHTKLQSHRAYYSNEIIHVDTLDVGTCVVGTHLSCIQVRTDGFTGRKEASVLSSMDDSCSRDGGDAFINDHINKYGACRVVQTDQGKEFQDSFHDMLVKYNIDHQMTGVGCSISHGIAERANRDILQGLRAELMERELDYSDWLNVLPFVLDKLNRSCTSIGDKSAFEYVNGSPPIFHGISLLSSFLESERDSSPKGPQYSVGERVLFFHPSMKFGHGSSRGMKLEGQWEDMIVERTLGHNMYVIRAHPLNAFRLPSYRVLVISRQLRKYVDPIHNPIANAPPLQTPQISSSSPTPSRNTLCIYRYDVNNLLRVGKILGVDTNNSCCIVQQYGAYSRGKGKLINRSFLPAWCHPTDPIDDVYFKLNVHLHLFIYLHLLILVILFPKVLIFYLTVSYLVG